jgi:transposase
MPKKKKNRRTRYKFIDKQYTQYVSSKIEKLNENKEHELFKQKLIALKKMDSELEPKQFLDECVKVLAEKWTEIEPLIPINERKHVNVGRPSMDRKKVLAALIYHAGYNKWTDLPKVFGSCDTISKYRKQWIEAGVFRKLFEMGILPPYETFLQEFWLGFFVMPELTDDEKKVARKAVRAERARAKRAAQKAKKLAEEALNVEGWLNAVERNDDELDSRIQAAREYAEEVSDDRWIEAQEDMQYDFEYFMNTEGQNFMQDGEMYLINEQVASEEVLSDYIEEIHKAGNL